MILIVVQRMCVQVQASIKQAGHDALNDPVVQQQILDACKDIASHVVMWPAWCLRASLSIVTLCLGYCGVGGKGAPEHHRRKTATRTKCTSS